METPNLSYEEEIPKLSAAEKMKLERVGRILWLVEKINESGEIIPFPGINPEAYSNMKKDEDEFPDFSTPIDEIIERCEKEGVRIVLGKNPESGNFWVVPADSTEYLMDCIPPHVLVLETIGNEHLKELIQLKQNKNILSA